MFASLFVTLLADAPQQQAPGLWSMIPFLLALVAMWVLMTSSQRKKAKQHQEMLNNLKSGDKVTTSGGVIGVVVTVKERSISLRSDDSKFEVLKSAISEVLERKAEPAEAKS